ncbi:MAG: ABC transporter ATP-binding protein [Desulfobulbaceae bacterium]
MIVLDNVKKVFNMGRPNEFTAVHGVNLVIPAHQITALKGPSGSGKTTLLSMVGCMSRPTSGRIRISLENGSSVAGLLEIPGGEITSLPERFLTQIRRHAFGFIFQKHNLVSGLSVLENVILPAYPCGEPHAELKKRAQGLLELFDISSKIQTQVEWLSGGEAQRVAIARALINNPSVIIADEPTAHLDTKLSQEFMGILQSLKEQQKTVIVASHDPIVCDSVIIDEVVSIRDGKVSERED